MSIVVFQPYRIELTLTAQEPKTTEQLVAFLKGAEKGSPLRLLAVTQEGTPKVFGYQQEGSISWGLQFVVPEPEDGKSLVRKLVPLFAQAGWSLKEVRKVNEDGTLWIEPAPAS